MSTLKCTLPAGAITVVLGLSGAASAQCSNALFFGDSLSDTGSCEPVLPRRALPMRRCRPAARRRNWCARRPIS